MWQQGQQQYGYNNGYGGSYNNGYGVYGNGGYGRSNFGNQDFREWQADKRRREQQEMMGEVVHSALGALGLSKGTAPPPAKLGGPAFIPGPVHPPPMEPSPLQNLLGINPKPADRTPQPKPEEMAEAAAERALKRILKSEEFQNAMGKHDGNDSSPTPKRNKAGNAVGLAGTLKDKNYATLKDRLSLHFVPNLPSNPSLRDLVDIIEGDKDVFNILTKWAARLDVNLRGVKKPVRIERTPIALMKNIREE